MKSKTQETLAKNDQSNEIPLKSKEKTMGNPQNSRGVRWNSPHVLPSFFPHTELSPTCSQLIHLFLQSEILLLAQGWGSGMWYINFTLPSKPTWILCFFPTSLCGVLVFGSVSRRPPLLLLLLPSSLVHTLSTHNLSSHNLLTHNLSSHNLLTHNLSSHNSASVEKNALHF